MLAPGLLREGTEGFLPLSLSLSLSLLEFRLAAAPPLLLEGAGLAILLLGLGFWEPFLLAHAGSFAAAFW